jgi:hypothetical protein
VIRLVNASEIYGNGGDFLSVDIARENKLLNKWLRIKEADVRDMKETDFKTKEEKQVQKIVIGFDECNYELPLNKTNARRLISDINSESDEWIGKPIKLKVQMWGNGKEGLVIKSKQELVDDGEEIPSPSSLDKPDKILNPPSLKKLANKYSDIEIACGRVSNDGFDVDNGGVYSELSKMQRDGDISKAELSNYKTLLNV